MRSYIVELGEKLKEITDSSIDAESVIREAISNAEHTTYYKGGNWTEKDDLYACAGSCASKVCLLYTSPSPRDS